MNTKPYVFVATATASIIVCIVSFSETAEVQLLPASAPESLNVIYEPDETNMPPDLISATGIFNYRGMSDVLGEMDAKGQRFTFSSAEKSTIKGKEGTVITFPANAFVDEEGNAPQGDVKIVLKEYYDVQEILAAKLQTKSKGQILESAGMLHIEATSNGAKLKLKDGVVCEMKFPKRDENTDYKIFSGKRDPEGVMDWVLMNDDSSLGTTSADVNSFSQEFENFSRNPEESQLTSNINGDCFIQIVSSHRRDLFYITEMDYYQWKFRDFPQDLNAYFLSNFNPSLEMIDDFCENKLACEIQVTIQPDGSIRNSMVRKSSKPEYDAMFMEFVKDLPILNTEQLLKTPDDNNAFILKFGKANGSTKQGLVAGFRSQYKGNEDEKITTVSATDLNFYVFNASQLGWINADRFMMEEQELVDVYVQTSMSDSCYVSMVFDDMNSVLLGSNENDKILFKDVPKNKAVRIVSVRCVNGKPDMSSVKAITTGSDIKLEKYEPFSLASLDSEFKGFMQ
ncbi:MAG: TonB C-terminal domain-containing protein [Flavobacteriales bacterium]|nr:TonB C-terminal domain-containing protein [Flavobacteriales bacterium]